MAIRTFTGSEGSIYSAANDANWQEEQIAFVMAILGMDIDAIDTVTIDEIIETSRALFDVSLLNSAIKPILVGGKVASDSGADSSVEGKNYRHASESWIAAQKVQLEEVVRRNFHWRHLAKGVM